MGLRPDPGSWERPVLFSKPKNPDRGNEDGYVAIEHCFAVLDGVSSHAPKIDGLTPGQRAVKVGQLALAEAAEFSDPHRIVPHVTERLRTALRGQSQEGRPSFVFAAFFPRHNLIIRVGDCSYLVNGAGRNPGLMVDRVKETLRARILGRCIAQGKTVEDLLADDPSKDRLHDLTELWQPYFANNGQDLDLGYGVMNGEYVPDAFIEYIRVPEGAHSIILASDGYPPEALRRNITSTERRLQRLFKLDPLGITKWHSTRSVILDVGAFDDRTFVHTTAH